MADHKCKGTETCRSCKWYDANPSTFFCLIQYSVYTIMLHFFYLSRIECHPPMRRGCANWHYCIISNKTLLKNLIPVKNKTKKLPHIIIIMSMPNKHAILMNAFWANRKSVPKSVGHLIQTYNWTKIDWNFEVSNFCFFPNRRKSSPMNDLISVGVCSESHWYLLLSW